MASIFSGANEAELTGKRAPRLSDYKGAHVLKISDLKTDRSKKTRKPYAAFDFEVVKSTNPALAEGDAVGYATTKGSEYPEFFFSDIKRILGAAANKDPDKVTEDQMATAFANKKIVGRTLGVKVRPKPDSEYADYEWFVANGDTEIGAVDPRLGKSVANDDGEAPEPAEADPLFG